VNVAELLQGARASSSLTHQTIIRTDVALQTARASDTLTHSSANVGCKVSQSLEKLKKKELLEPSRFKVIEADRLALVHLNPMQFFGPKAILLI
jgi:hypothetical protein